MCQAAGGMLYDRLDFVRVLNEGAMVGIAFIQFNKKHGSNLEGCAPPGCMTKLRIWHMMLGEPFICPVKS